DNVDLMDPASQAVIASEAAGSDLVLDGPERPLKHVVVFNGRAPADLEARVAELGGTVTPTHDIGIAVILGLDPADAPELEKAVGAQYVEELAPFSLIEPASIAEPVLASMGASLGVASAD